MDVICESAFGYEVNALSYSPEANKSFYSLKLIASGFAYITLPFINKTTFYKNYIGHRDTIYKTVDTMLGLGERKVSI